MNHLRRAGGLLLGLAACLGPDVSGQRSEPSFDGPLVLTGVTILSFDGSAPRTGQSIVIESGRILRVGPADSIGTPAGFQVIARPGKFVMPGLIDMHVHNIVRDRWKLLGYGITSVRGMWGYPG